MARIRIALADDQKLFVESLARAIVSRAQDIDVVGIAYNGREVVAMVDQLDPDLVLMDVRMPIMDGVEACRIVRERFPATKVMMLTTFDDDEYVHDAMRYGALGYLLKNISPEEVVTSVRAVMAGAVQMSTEIAKRLFEKVYESMERRHVDDADDLPKWYLHLSAKERRILVLVSKGKTNKEIGDEVNLADQTVKNYISHMYRKLGIENRAGLIRLVMEARIPGAYR